MSIKQFTESQKTIPNSPFDFVGEASQAIRDAGGRFTTQRRIIIELLQDVHEHLDAEMLYRKAHARDASISLATVYRTLHVLEQNGLMEHRYLDHTHERKVYEPATAEEHYHFTCRRCKRVIEFETQQVARIKAALEVGLGVQVNHACLCIEGLCYTCRTAEES